MAYVEIWKVSCCALGPAGEAIVNTFHYGFDGADPASAAVDMAIAADAILPFLIQPFVTAGWNYQKCQVLCVAGGSHGRSAESSAHAPLAGVRAGASAPIDVCAICKVTGGSVGRENRGRSFFSPIKQSDVDVDGRYLVGSALAINAQHMADTVINTGLASYDRVLFAGPPHAAVRLLYGVMADMTGIQKRRRLRLPN
jgi:hypothetical protein